MPTIDTSEIKSIREVFLSDALILRKSVAWWEKQMARCLENINLEEQKPIPNPEKLQNYYSELRLYTNRAKLEDKNIVNFINKYQLFLND